MQLDVQENYHAEQDEIRIVTGGVCGGGRRRLGLLRGVPASSAPIGNNVVSRELSYELGQAVRPKYQQPLSSGVVYAALAASGELNKRADAAPASAAQSQPRTPASATAGCPNRYVGGGTSGGPNVKVNQDCSLRRQAEEVVAINPTNPNNLIAGQNDSRVGFNHCGYDFSFDGGKTWGDMVPPFYQFTLGDGHTADACSDPTATFDSVGNAYIGGLLFEVADSPNAFVVAKSNAGIGGAFYHTPAALSFPGVSQHPARRRRQRHQSRHLQRQGVHRRGCQRRQPQGEQRLWHVDPVQQQHRGRRRRQQPDLLQPIHRRRCDLVGRHRDQRRQPPLHRL